MGADLTGIAAFIKENKKELVEAILSDIDSDYNPNDMDKVDEFVADMATRITRNRFQVYYPNRYSNKAAIVRNIKGEGFPDWDNIREALVKSLLKEQEEHRQADPTCQVFTEEALRGEVEHNINDTFGDEIFWDEVRREQECIFEGVHDKIFSYAKDHPVYAYGRSGGYWGVDFTSDMLEYAPKWLEKYVSEGLESEAFFNHIKALDDTRYSVVEEGDRLFCCICDIFTKDFFEKEYDKGTGIRLTREARYLFSYFDKYLTGIISNCESTDFWVEYIETTKWHIRNRVTCPHCGKIAQLC